MEVSENSTGRKTPRYRTSLPEASPLSRLRTAHPCQSPVGSLQTFPDSRASHHTAVALRARKPDARTSPTEILRHSRYVESAEGRCWSIQNSNIVEDEVCQSFKGNQLGKP